jgi:hypothetical protein
MRLQTENRRGHTPGSISVDLSRASGFSFGGPPSAKRATFAPLAGSTAASRGHQRRVSNISTLDVAADPPRLSRSRFSYAGEALSDGMSVLTLPASHGEYTESPSRSPRSPYASFEMESMGKDIQTLVAALEETKRELAEANEAREVSDTCIDALRAFITEHNVGLGSYPVPEIPQPRPKPTSAGNATTRWGFGLWRAGESAKESTLMPPQVDVSQAKEAVSSSSPPSSYEPLSKKLGGFFGVRRMSSSAAAPVHSSQVEATAHDHGSDTSYSSINSPEPTSPVDIPQVANKSMKSLTTPEDIL